LKHNGVLNALTLGGTLKFNVKSIRFRLWIYFFLFAVALISVLWLLQVLFLNSFYEQMRIRESSGVAAKIETVFSAKKYKEDYTISEKLKHAMDSMSAANDMYLRLETAGGRTLYTSRDYVNDSDEPVFPTYYREEVKDLKKSIIEEGQSSFSETSKSNGVDNRNYQKYAQLLASDVENPDDQLILFIITPLYPIEGTLKILTTQLVYITVISLLIACIIGFYMSIRVSDPIKKITNTATKLGEGEYGIVFEDAHYSEINQLAETLTNTSLELAKSHQQQKDLVANISHDLRTPLTMIISYAEMIQDISGDIPERRNEHLKVIVEEARRLSELVTDLLEISKMQSGNKDMNRTDFSLKELTESILKSYSVRVEQEGFKLVFISQGTGIIRADEKRIGQVVSNLVSNAFKYAGRDKTIEVKMFDEDDFVRMEVSDHGIGIPKKDIKHIWERYHMASTNHRRSNSTGLGLSIVKEILMLHGAEFGVDSVLKKGSTFWFEIPKNVVDEIVEDSELEEEE
jgi:signal transduction histidine kinase